MSFQKHDPVYVQAQKPFEEPRTYDVNPSHQSESMQMYRSAHR